MHAGISDTAANASTKFWALFGAVNVGDVKINGANGDAAIDTLLVDGLALNDIYQAFGSSARTSSDPPAFVAFDRNLDGNVNGVDLNQLYANFGTIWKI